MEARRKVAVIGAYVAEELYGGSQNAVGETVKVMNIAKDNNYKLILATAPN